MNNGRMDDGMADLRASSLETLMHMVSAGIGCTLVPALALKHEWIDNSDLKLKPLERQLAYRTISLVSRKTFPRRRALEAFAQVILDHLPQTVQRITAVPLTPSPPGRGLG